MAKRIISDLTSGVENEILNLVTANPGQTVSALVKLVTVAGFTEQDKKTKRQMIQNTVDRLYREGKIELAKGAKKTGRPVTVYNPVTK